MRRLNAFKFSQVAQMAGERQDSFQKEERHCFSCSFDVKFDYLSLSCNKVSIEIYCLVLQGKLTNVFWNI